MGNCDLNATHRIRNPISKQLTLAVSKLGEKVDAMGLDFGTIAFFIKNGRIYRIEVSNSLMVPNQECEGENNGDPQP